MKGIYTYPRAPESSTARQRDQPGNGGASGLNIPDSIAIATLKYEANLGPCLRSATRTIVLRRCGGTCLSGEEDNVPLYYSLAKALELVDMAPQQPHQLWSVGRRNITTRSPSKSTNFKLGALHMNLNPTHSTSWFSAPASNSLFCDEKFKPLEVIDIDDSSHSGSQLGPRRYANIPTQGNGGHRGGLVLFSIDLYKYDELLNSLSGYMNFAAFDNPSGSA
ncbi:hypothetical protein B0H14DRAFT_3141592 [Mycena olivaceomarginata]|nr:hypothetical protein B0H14DRAFT_3141592 [Mycena olivaceomarginata]